MQRTGAVELQSLPLTQLPTLSRPTLSPLPNPALQNAVLYVKQLPGDGSSGGSSSSSSSLSGGAIAGGPVQLRCQGAPLCLCANTCTKSTGITGLPSCPQKPELLFVRLNIFPARPCRHCDGCLCGTGSCGSRRTSCGPAAQAVGSHGSSQGEAPHKHSVHMQP